MTHTYFAEDVYDKIDKNIKNKIKNNVNDLKTFAQGPDPLFFYDIIGVKRIIKKFGGYVHQNKTQDFYINLINYIKENNLEQDSSVLPFLYGFICHYVLDSTIHPFIAYKTGEFKKKEKNTYKYNGLHHEMEYYIDIYLIYQKERIKPKNFKVYKKILNTKNLTPSLSKTIDFVFKQTYNKDNMSSIYLKSIKKMKTFFKIFNYDRYGLKKILYKMIDLVSPNSFEKKEILSFNMPHNRKEHYLNLEKCTWNHPMYKEEIYNYSVIELYIIAIKKATYLINETDKILNSSTLNISKLKLLFDNLSYKTGKNCDDKTELKYFEF